MRRREEKGQRKIKGELCHRCQGRRGQGGDAEWRQKMAEKPSNVVEPLQMETQYGSYKNGLPLIITKHLNNVYMSIFENITKLRW